MIVTGLIVGLLAVWLVQSRPWSSNRGASQHTVSSVTSEIRRLALQRSTTPGLEDGGAMGMWWISAASVDEPTNTFHDFRLRAGAGGGGVDGLQLAARTATLIVDPDENTISFDLRNVVVLSMPGGRSGGENGGLMRLDSFMLGPAPYRRNIVADAPPRFEPPADSRLAGVGD